MNFADPKNDVAFKKIFGNENKKEILISFLNNILDFVGTPKEIVDISIMDPFQAPKIAILRILTWMLMPWISGVFTILLKCR